MFELFKENRLAFKAGDNARARRVAAGKPAGGVGDRSISSSSFKKSRGLDQATVDAINSGKMTSAQAASGMRASDVKAEETGQYSAKINGEKVYFNTKEAANAALDKAKGGLTPTEEALADLEMDPAFQALPEDVKNIYRRTVQSWDTSKELNTDAILKEFEKIKKNTIDPYFSEQVDLFKANVEESYKALQTTREAALEAEKMSAEKNITDTQENLEASGMTFSGKGVSELGAKSAYAQEGENGLPKQIPFGGTFTEGRINTANRLAATDSQARWQETLAKMGQKAEATLGSSGLGNLIPGYNAVGGISGDVYQNQQDAYGNVLRQLSSQNTQNVDYGKNLSYKFPNFSNLL